MLSRLGLVFLFVVQTNSLSVLTDDKSQSTTILIRQLMNQETLIRMALDRKVNDLVKSMTEMKNKMVTTNEKLQDAKREIQINKQQLQDAKREIETNNQQLQDAKREIQTNNQQLQDAKREIQTNNLQINNAKREILTNNQQLQNAAMEIAALKNENSALKGELQVQSNVTTLLSDNLQATINTVKLSQNSQRELSSAVLSLQAFQKNMSFAADTAVGFTTKLSGSYSSTSSIIRGSEILYNGGNAYNGTVFTCPSPGLYLFHVSLIDNAYSNGIWIFKNSQRLTLAFSGNVKTGGNGASVSAAVWLDVGDQVYLIPYGLSLNIDHNSAFSGLKIN